MANFKNTVDKILSNEFEQPQFDKNKLFEQSRKYIIMQQLLADFKQYLAEDEAVVAHLGLSNTDNTAVFSTGILGFSSATTAKAKSYVEAFNDTRGNRLLIFTNQRIFFLFPLEFFENQIFYSYPYTTIHAFTIIEQSKTRQGNGDFTVIDFESQRNLFTETLKTDEYEQLCRIKEQIPAFKEIPIKAKIVRRRKFDYLFGNLRGWVNVGYLISGLFLLFFFLLLIGFIFGWGPFADFHNVLSM